MTRGRRFVVVGAGGHAKVAIASILSAGGEVVRVLDDDPRKHGTKILGHTVEGPVDDGMIPADTVVVLGIGSNRGRAVVAERLHVEYGTVVDPSAVVHGSATVGEGTVIFAGAIVQADARLGRHVIVNTAASVDHDCVLGDFSHVAPGARLAGDVAVGEGALVGIAGCAAPGARIGRWAVVGAGAAVVSDIPDAVVAVGVPAKVLREVR